jgi:hypothetical protein
MKLRGTPVSACANTRVPTRVREGGVEPEIAMAADLRDWCLCRSGTVYCSGLFRVRERKSVFVFPTGNS